MRHDRNISLDGLRGFAMLLVLTWHSTFLTDDHPVNRAFLSLLHYNWVGMHFFFALSGLLITGILLDTKGQKRFFTNFYARRFLRIFPLYYLILFVSFYLLPHLPHSRAEKFASVSGDEWSYWLYLSNVTIGNAGYWRHPIVDVAWSLAVEEQFYIVWPLVVYFVSPARLFFLCVGILVGSCAYRTGLVLTGANDLTIYVSTLARCDAIAAGSLVALVLRVPSRASSWIKAHAHGLLVGSALVTFSVLIHVGGEYNSRPVQILGHGLISVLSGAILLNLALPERPTRLIKFFSWSFFRLIGKYSYGIYLFHLPLRAVIRDMVYPPASFLTWFGTPLPGQLLFYVLSGAFVLVAAALSFHLFESPVLSLKRFFEYEDDRALKISADEPTRASRVA